MNDRLRTYWAGRSVREQRLLAVMFAMLAAVILWFGIVSPLQNARAEAITRLEQVTLVSGQVSMRVEALRHATRAVPRPLGTALVTAVGLSATEAGFTPSRLDAQGEDRVMIVISSARSQPLFAWLETLSRRGVFAEKLTLRPNADATVGVEATLRVRRS